MAALLANLGTNPLSTPTGQKIEQATDGSLPSENWALNMEICDLINETDEGPKDAIKAIKRRLQQNVGKNYAVVLHTLTVLETCVKNCGKRFQLLACSKDFVQDLMKLIGPKNEPPAAVQERVLGLIQSWADAFQGNMELQGVCQAYLDLKQKGIVFPMTDLDAMAPIHTPERTVPAAPKSPASQMPDHSTHVLPPSENAMPTRVSPNPEACNPSSSAVGLNQDQLVKLRGELNIVEGNMKLFCEMLTELTPGQEHAEDLELLRDLHKTCFAMQNRIVELIDKVGIEEVTSELLRINDEMNNMFLRYERYEKRRTVTPSSQETPAQVQPSLDMSEKPLIDFGDFGDTSESDVAAKMADLNIAKSSDKALEVSNNVPAAATNSTSINAIADEFDMFAHSRNTTADPAKDKGSSYADNMNINQSEIGLAKYMQSKGQPNLGMLQGDSHKPITSIEFERFLEDRVAAENPPASGMPEGSRAVSQAGVAPAAAVPSSQSIASGISNRRQIEKEDTENALFAL